MAPGTPAGALCTKRGGCPSHCRAWRRTVRDGSQVVTRHGEEVVVMVLAEEYRCRAARSLLTIVRLKFSRVEPCPGIRARSTKSGVSSSSMTSRFPLSSSSKKRRTMALFSSADDTAASSSSIPIRLVLQRVSSINDASRTSAAHLCKYKGKELSERTGSPPQGHSDTQKTRSS